MRKFSLFACAVLLIALLPIDAAAQRNKGKTSRTTYSYGNDCCYANRFVLEPYAGAFKDAYDIGAQDDTGYQLGVRIGYTTSSRSRLYGNVAYSKTEDVADSRGLADYYVYDNTWVFTTGGGEFDVVPGRTSAAVGLQAGAAWRRVDFDGTVGTPGNIVGADDGFTAYEVAIPSLTLRHRISSRAAISASLQDHIFDFFEGTAKHSVGLALGVALR